jgi:hypothetical protein
VLEFLIKKQGGTADLLCDAAAGEQARAAAAAAAAARRTTGPPARPLPVALCPAGS